MQEIYLVLLGSIIGYFGTISGAILAECIKEKRELKVFYSWLAFFLERLIKKRELSKGKEDLTTPSLHYTYNNIWTQIPQKDGKLEVRELILKFLKGGGELDKIIDDDKYNQLLEWLYKKSRWRNIFLKI